MYTQLLREFSRIKESNIQERETYFDICGYPHYENVVSNVLAFFFDPFKPHELKDTCVQALLHATHPEIENIDEVWEVEREVRTDKGTFIDIFFKNDDYVVLIENKVYANLYNDLDGYFRFVEKQFPQQKVLPIVLCLHTPTTENLFGFQVITYDKFFQTLRSHLGNVIDRADFRYMQLLTDLIVNMEKLKEGTKMDDKFLEFVSDHDEELVDLVKKIKTYRDTLRSKVKEVNGLLPDEVNNLKLKKWEHRDLNQLFDIAVIDVVLSNDAKLAIDAVLDHKGWRIEIFQRGIQPNFDVVAHCQSKGIAGEVKNGRFHSEQKFKFNSNPDSVAEHIKNILEKLTQI